MTKMSTPLALYGVYDGIGSITYFEMVTSKSSCENTCFKPSDQNCIVCP